MQTFPTLLTGLAMLGASLSWAQRAPSRLPGSPYPASRIPDTLFAVSDGSWTAGQRLAVGTLQGLLARTKPRIYRIPSTWYSRWLDDLSGRRGIQVVRTYQNDFPGLLRRFRGELEGYILCDAETPSVNVALSLSAVLGGIAATPDLVAVLESAGLPLLLDARGKDEEWAYSLHADAFSRKTLGYLRERDARNLSDFSVFAGAFHFHEPVASPLTDKALSRMDPNSTLLGWGEDEYQLILAASARSIHVHPADYANNLSALSQFEGQGRQQVPASPPPGPQGVHTVCFLMSDGDNLQWLLGDFSDTRWFGSPSRGRVNLGWTVSPALSELAPTVLDAFYRDAASGQSTPARDHFVAGPSGMGYMFPDRFPALDSAAALTARFMAKADLRILNVLGAGTDIAHLSPYLRRPEIDAVFYYPFSDYSGLKGSISFLENKPVIGGFANLWSGFESAASLAARLNARPRNVRVKDGYSLIPVHAWSNSVDSVVRCAGLLDAGVRVVAPDEFVRMIRANLGPTSGLPRSGSARPGEALSLRNRPGRPGYILELELPRAGKVEVLIYRASGTRAQRAYSGRLEKGRRMIPLSSEELPAGAYTLEARLEGRSLGRLALRP